MRKSTYIDRSSRQRVHTWTDEKFDFHAEIRRDSDGWWVVSTSRGAERTVQLYQRAVDIVMDEYRLVKAGYSSWEEPAAEMAEGLWEELSEDEQQDLINAARLTLRAEDALRDGDPTMQDHLDAFTGVSGPVQNIVTLTVVADAYGCTPEDSMKAWRLLSGHQQPSLTAMLDALGVAKINRRVTEES